MATLKELVDEVYEETTQKLISGAREFAKGYLQGYLEDREDIHWMEDHWMGYEQGTDINFYWDDVLRQQHATLYFVTDCEGKLKEDRYRLDESVQLF